MGNIPDMKIIENIRKIEAGFAESPEEEWNKSFGGPLFDYGLSVQQTADGGYIIVGNYESNRGDIWLIKTDSFGSIIWGTTFGGSSEGFGWSVRQSFDEGFIIAGYTRSFGSGKDDVWLIKTDEYGNEIWNKTFGGDGT